MSYDYLLQYQFAYSENLVPINKKKSWFVTFAYTKPLKYDVLPRTEERTIKHVISIAV